MIDYYKAYLHFIEVKKTELAPTNRLVKKQVHVQHLERHHVCPRSLGGRNERDNIVLLNEIDHAIAHILFQIAMLQRNDHVVMNYTIRTFNSNLKSNITTYWNPVSKIKIQCIDSNGVVHVLPICKAARFMAMSVGTNYDKKKIDYKNKIICRILTKCWSENNMYCGFKLSIVD